MSSLAYFSFKINVTTCHGLLGARDIALTPISNTKGSADSTAFRYGTYKITYFLTHLLRNANTLHKFIQNFLSLNEYLYSPNKYGRRVNNTNNNINITVANGVNTELYLPNIYNY